MIRYCPDPSVTTDRTFSINAGLLASTVTPGSTAPDASRTTPAMLAWAYATDGAAITTMIIAAALTALYIETLHASAGAPPRRGYRTLKKLLCWGAAQFFERSS